MKSFLQNHGDQIYDGMHWSLLSRNIHIPIDLIDTPAYMHKWDWSALSVNPAIPWSFIRSHVHLPWDWDGINENPSITLADILSGPTLPWNWSRICKNPNITAEFVATHVIPRVDKFMWETYALLHKRVWPDNMSFVFYTTPAHAAISLDYAQVSASSQVTLDDIRRHWNTFAWDPVAVSANPNITPEFVVTHINTIAWDWTILSANPGMPLAILKMAKDILFIDPTTTAHTCASASASASAPALDTSAAYASIFSQLQWQYISENPNLTASFITDMQNRPHAQTHEPGLNWNWRMISQHPAITWDVIQLNPAWPWDWDGVSKNPNITWAIVDAHDTIPWNIDAICEHCRD